MPIKLSSPDVTALVRNINGYFAHYYQYEGYFIEIGIIDYADPRDYTKRGGFIHEFTNRSDQDLYKMLTEMKKYVQNYQTKHPNIISQKETSISFIDKLIEKYFTGISDSIITPPVNASESVQAACNEVNRLIIEGQYPIAIDRAHTFFQAYLRDKCSDWQIDIKADAGIKDALLSIVNNHKYFTEINRISELKNVFNSLSNMCDRFDTFRNNNSLAHPPQSLLANNEAKLMINVIKTLFDYIENIGDN